MPIFDSHAHYDSVQFDSDRDALLTSLKKRGVSYVMSVASSVHQLKKTASFLKNILLFFPAQGYTLSTV